MIQFDHVSKRYEAGNYGLNDISFQVDDGEMLFVTGHSGAGKSTLLRLIGLIERPTRGQLLVDGRNLAKLPNRQVPYHRRQVGSCLGIFSDAEQDKSQIPVRKAFQKRIVKPLCQLECLFGEHARPPGLGPHVAHVREHADHAAQLGRLA